MGMGGAGRGRSWRVGMGAELACEPSILMRQVGVPRVLGFQYSWPPRVGLSLLVLPRVDEITKLLPISNAPLSTTMPSPTNALPRPPPHPHVCLLLGICIFPLSVIIGTCIFILMLSSTLVFLISCSFRHKYVNFLH